MGKIKTVLDCFISANYNPSRRADFLNKSSEQEFRARVQSKLSFELLEINSVAQKNLPLQRAEKDLRSQLLCNIKLDIVHIVESEMERIKNDLNLQYLI